jgi:hypothetical protein
MIALRVSVAAACLAGWVQVQAQAQGQPIERIKPTDNSLSCLQLNGEINTVKNAAQEARALEAQEKAAEGKVGIASTAAAIAGRTGLFGQIGGLAGSLFGQTAAQTASTALQQQAAQAAQQAADRARQADARHQHLSALFAARGCDATNLQAEGKVLDSEALKHAAQSGTASAGIAGKDDTAKPATTDPGALRGLIDRAAASARTGLPELSLAHGGGSRIPSVVGKAQKVVVAGYRVAFVDRTGTSASSAGSRSTSYNVFGTVRTVTSTSGQYKTLELQLDNVNTGLMQAITERLYADFVEQLKAQGLQVLDRKSLAGSPNFGKVEFTKLNQESVYVVSPTGDPRNFRVVAPAEQPMFFLAGETLGDRGLMDLTQLKSLMFTALDVQAVPLVAQVTIDFATTDTSGRSRIVNRADVDGAPVISLGANITTTLSAFHSANTIMGEWGTVRLDKPVMLDGEYATVKNLAEPNNVNEVANAVTGLLGAVTGTAGTIRSTDKRLFVADPVRYSELALRAGFAANKAFAAATR